MTSANEQSTNKNLVDADVNKLTVLLIQQLNKQITHSEGALQDHCIELAEAVISFREKTDLGQYPQLSEAFAQLKESKAINRTLAQMGYKAPPGFSETNYCG